MNNRKRMIPIILILIIILEGCAIFQSSRKMGMEPFSENSGILFNEAVKVSRPFQFKSLSVYTDVYEYDKIKNKAEPLIRAFKGIVYYSNQLVAIYNSDLKTNQKNKQLALYLQETFQKAKHKERIDSIGLHKKDVELVLSEIRNANTYMDAIAAADPIINTIVLALFDRMDEIEEMISTVIVTFENQVFEDYGLIIDNYIRVRELKNMTQETLSKLYIAQSKDRSILDTLLQNDLNLSNYIKSSTDISKEEFINAEEYLFRRLDHLDTMMKQLEYDKKDYFAIKQEVSAWHQSADEKLSIARNAITVWAQSHRNLGQGIEVPPLIDINTIAGLVGAAAGSLAP